MAAAHGGWLRQPSSLPWVSCSSTSEKIPRLGTCLLFVSWHSRKTPFLEKTGGNVLLIFLAKCSLFLLQTKAPTLGHEALYFPWKINSSAAPSRTVFSHCPVGNRAGCSTGAVAEELPSVLSFAVSLAYSVITLVFNSCQHTTFWNSPDDPLCREQLWTTTFVIFLWLIQLIVLVLSWIVAFVGNKSWRIMFGKEF